MGWIRKELWIVLGLVLPWGAVAARERITVEAVSGEPFGVAAIQLPIMNETGWAAETNAFGIQGPPGRVLYPAFTPGRIRKWLGNVLGVQSDGPAALSISFLFRGDTPFDVTVYAPQPIELRIVPQPDPRRLKERMVHRWWHDYLASVKAQAEESDYEPLVQTYLTSMLSRRLRLDPPKVEAAPAPGALLQSFELLMGVEGLRLAQVRNSMLGTRRDVYPSERSGSAMLAQSPFPPPIQWGPAPAPEFDLDVELEPMASHVPEECFYIRFGRFSNYVWLSKLMDEYAGGIGGMITLRGVEAAGDHRVETQLALKQSALGDLLGDAFISDVAIVGRDLYLQQGAAIGLIFQARNALLGGNFDQERKQVLESEKQNGATLETVSIAGRDVSFLSTPDNRIRSFYAVDGDYHLVTTSRAIVERFFAAGQGERTLAATAEFKHARTRMPLRRDDTAFMYFSTAFFRELVGPQYQIELGRRLIAETEMRVYGLARWAARAEQLDPDDPTQWIASGLLPADFGKRPDGSRMIWTDRGPIDSSRGARGTFVPIPDMQIESVTRLESSLCLSRDQFYSDEWKQMDPIMAAIKRYAADGERREQIVIDAHVSPLDEGKYGKFLSVLGPASAERIRSAPGDIVSIQANVKGGLFRAEVPPHYLFLGVQDNSPISYLKPNGLFKTLRILQTTPGYLGAWPKPGFLDMLPLGLGGGRPDPAGFSPLLLGLWRRQVADLSLLSFDRPLLEYVTPYLVPEPAPELAQIRLHIGDISQARLTAWVNELCYERSRLASVGNLRLLHTIQQQLQVPAKQAKDVAEELLDGRLVCTLGGEYQCQEIGNGWGTWSSTWGDDSNHKGPNSDVSEPASGSKYEAPLLNWFRGLDSTVLKEPDRLIVHAELAMQRKPSDTKIELPLFNLFKKQDAEQSSKLKDPAPSTRRPEEPPAKTPAEPRPEPRPEPLPAPAKKSVRKF